MDVTICAKMAPPGGDIKFVFHRSKPPCPALTHAKKLFCISLSKKKLQKFRSVLKKTRLIISVRKLLNDADVFR